MRDDGLWLLPDGFPYEPDDDAALAEAFERMSRLPAVQTVTVTLPVLETVPE